MKYIFIADFFSDEINGGGELNNKYLIELLKTRNHDVESIKSINVTSEFVEENKKANFILANFVQVHPLVLQQIQKLNYVIYEHDHKYLKSRNPAIYRDYKAPKNALINESLYKNAIAVFCQSSLHAEILNKNLNLENVKNLSGNIWSDETLNLIEELSKNTKKDRFSVMNSDILHKNTAGSVEYCKTKKEKYELIHSHEYHDFLEQLSKNKKFVFLPQTPETLSRVAVEARMLDVEVHTNSRVGATKEKWFKLRGQELISFMRQRKDEIVDAIEYVFDTRIVTHSLKVPSLPKISLITSLFKGDDHIEAFMDNITSQTVFDQCELVIINANSPGNEDSVIKRYMEKYSNIIYEKLDYDPGIYGCWNLAIEKSSGEFITNANLDDRRSKQQLEILSTVLNDNPDLDLVYSECLMTTKDHETYNENSSNSKVYPVAEFSNEAMIKCLPGCMPVWRRRMHDKSGLFNEDYKFGGDWDMWLKAVRAGSKFKKVSGAHGLYYYNPSGLSTDPKKQKERFSEEKEVFWKYTDIFGERLTDHYRSYFSQ